MMIDAESWMIGAQRARPKLGRGGRTKDAGGEGVGRLTPRRAVSGSLQLLGSVARSPSDARRLPRWLAERGVAPLELSSPWMNYKAIDALGAAVTTGSRVFEYGSGGSTVWFAQRVGSVEAVEHDTVWAESVGRAVAGLPNATVTHAPAPDGDYSRYISAIDEAAADAFDVVVVDGRQRVACVAAARDRIAPGGLLVLDDSHRARYSGAFEILAGWPTKTYRGIKSGSTELVSTTFWRAPDC